MLVVVVQEGKASVGSLNEDVKVAESHGPLPPCGNM